MCYGWYDEYAMRKAAEEAKARQKRDEESKQPKPASPAPAPAPGAKDDELIPV